MEGYLIALIVLTIYFAVLILGYWLKFWEKLHLTLYGPFLMLKTKRGKRLLDRLARPAKFWSCYGRISIGISIGSMFLLMALLVWEAFLVLDIPESAAPAPELIVGLPGINPVIPLWYGILGLVVALIVHELAHGIVSRARKIKVESMGLLFLIFPMGAFVEPNEEELQNTTRQNRSMIFAAGPATNIIVAFIFLIILLGVFAPSVEPVTDGAIITGVVPDSPAGKFGIPAWSSLEEINGYEVKAASDLNSVTFDEPGESVYASIFYEGQITELELPGGIVITSVYEGPAYDAGLKPGMILYSLNETVIHSLAEFRSVTENATSQVPIEITVLRFGFDETKQSDWFIQDTNITNITLTTKWLYYSAHYPDLNDESYQNISYMGVTSSVFGVRAEDSDYAIAPLSNAFSEIDSLEDLGVASLRLIALPFLGDTPVEPPTTNFYEPSGALSFMPADLYWILTNSIYWIFWINLMLGLTNALPAVPLDGGYIMRDKLAGLIERLRRTPGIETEAQAKSLTTAESDRISRVVILFLSVLVLFLIVWQLIGPRI